MDGIIFDVDGTIWDATDVVAESWNAVIREHSNLDLQIGREDLMQLFGKTMEEIYAILFPDFSQEEQTRLGTLCFNAENELLETKSGVLYDQIEETIATLAKHHPLFIVSNCQCGYIEVMLKTTGLGKYITDHLCYGDTLTAKGQTILRLMKRNNLQNPIYVGDTIGDCNACKDAGIPFIFAEYGFGEVPEATLRIQTPADLLTLINKL